MSSLKLNDFVKVNNRARSVYTYTKPNSKGKIIAFGKDKKTRKDLALVKFLNLKSSYDRDLIGEEYPILVNHLSKLKDKKKTETKNFFLCKECLEYYDDKDLKKIKNKIVCTKCFSKYVKCFNCSETFIPNINSKKSDNKNYCEKCVKKLFVKCDKCNTEHPKEKIYKINLVKYCNNCYKKFFFKCNICKKITHTSSSLQYSRIGKVCKTCYDGNYTIKNYTYMPKNFQFSKLNSENGKNNLFMGIELEVVTYEDVEQQSYLAEELTRYLEKLGISNLFYYKEDSSLRNEEGIESGMEIVSHPFTLKYGHKKLKFKKILSWLKQKEFVSYRGGKCGLHVHLSRNFFTGNDIEKLRLFYSTNIENIIAFSKRDERGLNTFAKPEHYDIEHYKDSYKNHFGQNNLRTQRHSAINISSKGTIELRTFRGTLYYPRFIATLQFCDALAQFIKIYSVVVMKEKRSWELFKEFLTKENNWKQLQNYLKKETL